MSMGLARRTGAAVMVVSLLLAGVALAAASPLHKGKVYDTGGGISARFTLTLITSATNAGTLIAGPPQAPLGSQFALAVGSVRCPHAPRNTGLAKGNTPFALFSFPGARLKPHHGTLGFSVKQVDRRQQLLGSPVKPFRFTVKITGTVSSASKITGTVTASGGPCALKHPVAWTAVYSPKEKAAPGA